MVQALTDTSHNPTRKSDQQMAQPREGKTEMQFASRILGRTIDASMIIGATAVALMMLHITIDVISKHVFNVPMPGTITVVSNYYMILVAFLPLAFTERRNGHIAVEVLVENFSFKAQRGINVIAMILGALVFGALAYRGWFEAERARNVGSFMIEQDAKLLTWPARYLLPIGFALMTLTLVFKVFIALFKRGGQDHREPFF